jgi:hypothetical protein
MPETLYPDAAQVADSCLDAAALVECLTAGDLAAAELLVHCCDPGFVAVLLGIAIIRTPPEVRDAAVAFLRDASPAVLRGEVA